MQILVSCILTFAEEYHTTKRTKASNNDVSMQEEPPEGYYAFVESPNAEPPKVKPPPYVESDKECHGREIFYFVFKIVFFQ